MDTFKPGKPSPITVLIEEHFNSMSEGEVVTFEELRDLTGLDCSSQARNKNGYGYLTTARKRLERRGVNFKPVPGVGYEKLTPDDTVTHTRESRIPHVRRHSERSLLILTSLDDKRLNNARREERNGMIVSARMTEIMSTQHGVNRAIEVTRENPKATDLDCDRLLSAYLSEESTET